jgi:hypothetical protein
MINPRRPLPKLGFKKPEIKIVVEKKNRGIGWLLFAEDVKTGSRTYAGAAMSQDTLEYNVRKAKMKFGIPID